MIPKVMGLAKLAKMSFDGADIAPIWEELTRRLSDDNGTDDGSKYAALLDMCMIDQMRGSSERGLQFQALALEECRLYQMPAKTQPPRLTVLGFVIAGKINANTPIEFLIENADITLLLLYVVPGKPLPPVPAHDAAIVLVADSEAAGPVLREIECLTENWPRPVLNRPGQIPEVGRERLHHLLAPLPGVSIPQTVRAERANFIAALAEYDFPVIVRPIDSHAGDGLEKLACAGDADAYLSQRPEAGFSVSPFQDYRSADGQYRKYRVIFVDGKAFPCHMAISDHWMIHYLNAGMEESAEKRREEAEFLDNFYADFGLRHRRALAEIAEVLGLDYFGIDCAEMPDGRLLVFEAGTALVVHAMDPPDIFPYKARQMQTLFAAFQNLLYQQ
jgi:hypothetical protein